MKKLLLTILFVINAAQFNSAQTFDSNVDHEPNPAFPYGRLNPKAPAETAQFSFMIGVFDCSETELDPATGKWRSGKSVWSSTYFLNGYGVQDRYWSDHTVATGTRIFDKAKGKWIVNYFQSIPRYFSGVWEGLKEGDSMIMRLKSGESENRLTFSEIRKDGFEWVGESVTGEKESPFWKISCKRR